MIPKLQKHPVLIKNPTRVEKIICAMVLSKKEPPYILLIITDFDMTLIEQALSEAKFKEIMEESDVMFKEGNENLCDKLQKHNIPVFIFLHEIGQQWGSCMHIKEFGDQALLASSCPLHQEERAAVSVHHEADKDEYLVAQA
ncbi:hypothetical protein GH733_008619, partial [Mirounga leonina]